MELARTFRRSVLSGIFEITGIDGDAYVKEKKAEPAPEIPYAASILQLIDHVVDGQQPILTHKQNFSSSTGVEKFTISERTVIYSYLSDRCHYGWYDVKAGFYRDFQCTDEVYSVTFNTNQDKGTFGIFEPGTYYIMVKCGSNEDGISIPQELNWYIGGVKYADVAKEPVVTYSADGTKANVKLGLLNYENITKINCYKGTVDYSDTKAKKLSSVGKNALKGIHANAKIKVPSSKLSKYKKLLKGKGQGKKVKITK